MSSPIIGVLFFFILACAISGGIILLFRAIDKSKPEIVDYRHDDDFDFFDDDLCSEDLEDYDYE